MGWAPQPGPAAILCVLYSYGAGRSKAAGPVLGAQVRTYQSSAPALPELELNDELLRSINMAQIIEATLFILNSRQHPQCNTWRAIPSPWPGMTTPVGPQHAGTSRATLAGSPASLEDSLGAPN